MIRSLALFLIAAGCSASAPNRVPVSERLPSVIGESLNGDEVRIPEDLPSGVNVLLLGYKQRAQYAGRTLNDYVYSTLKQNYKKDTN